MSSVALRSRAQPDSLGEGFRFHNRKERFAPLMDRLERGLKSDRRRLPSGDPVALHSDVDGQGREAGEPRGDLDFSRREALLEWRFDRESFADRGYDQPLANRPEQLSVGGVLPDID